MKKSVVAMVSLLLLSSGAGLIMPNQVTGETTVAQAKSKTKNLKSFPKKFRHSWYHYNTNGTYDKVVIKTHTLQFVYPNTFVFQPQQQQVKQLKKNGYTWVNTRDEGNTAGTNFYYRITSKKWSGKKHTAMIGVRGSAFSMPVTYYSTKTHHS